MAGHDCVHEEDIGGMKATLKSLRDGIREVADGQKEFVGLLKDIASQGAQIVNLDKGQQILFKRQRDLEKIVTEDRIKVGFIVAGVSFVVSVGGTVAVKFFMG